MVWSSCVRSSGKKLTKEVYDDYRRINGCESYSLESFCTEFCDENDFLNFTLPKVKKLLYNIMELSYPQMIQSMYRMNTRCLINSSLTDSHKQPRASSNSYSLDSQKVLKAFERKEKEDVAPATKKTTTIPTTPETHEEDVQYLISLSEDPWYMGCLLFQQLWGHDPFRECNEEVLRCVFL